MLQATPTLVAELSVVELHQALAMPRNGSPPSSPSHAALGEEGCYNSVWQNGAASLVPPHFGAAAGSDAESCPAGSHSAAGGQRPEGSQFSRSAAGCDRPWNEVAAAELDQVSGTRVEAHEAEMRREMAPSTVQAASSTADELTEMADELPEAAPPSDVGCVQSATLIKPIRGSLAWHSPGFDGESQATPRPAGQSPESSTHGDGLPLIRTTANAPEWASRGELLQWAATHTSLRLPPFEGGPRTTTAQYAKWRDELRSFQCVNRLPDDAMACLLLEQGALLGGLMKHLLEDLHVDDVIAPMRERE